MFCVKRKKKKSKGLRIMIGTGKETSIWTEPWLATNPPRPPQASDEAQHDFRVVSDNCSMWDMEKIETAIRAEDRPHI